MTGYVVIALDGDDFQSRPMSRANAVEFAIDLNAHGLGPVKAVPVKAVPNKDEGR